MTFIEKYSLPQEWQLETLGDICITGRGRVISQEYIKRHKGPYPVYSSQTKEDGVFGYIDTYDFEGDWLTWTTDGANAGTVFFRQGKFNCTNVCGTVKPKKEYSVDLHFLAYLLNTLTPAYVNIAMGNPKLMNGVFESIVIPLPPTLAEQKRIVAILTEQMAAVEKARAAAEARLEAAKSLRAAYLREVFESVEAKQWKQVKFDEIAILQRGHDLPFANKIVGKYPIVTSSGIAGYHNEFKAKSPGVVTGRSGSIGKVFYITEDYWPHNTSLYVKNFKGNLPLYIFYFLQWLNTAKVGSGTGVPTLDRKEVHKLIVGSPDIHIQNHIASFLSEKMVKIENLTILLEQEFESIKSLPAVILQQAFTGGL